jgi:ABC-2 type transport system ATP-binding protein
MHALYLDSVVKSFGDVCAVDHLSAAVPAGCTYGFLGPNGAGKTTTIRMIMNIISPDAGRIEVLGRDSRGDVSRSIGYMPEERGLYRKMPVAAVVEYFARLKGLSAREARVATARWLERVELADWAKRRVEDLSRGMQQKLQFVVTAVSDPEVLILDEPFSALDPINVDLMKSILREMRSRGTTIVLSTHIMEQAEQMCDYILLINQGRKILDGTLKSIRDEHRTNSVVLEAEGDSSFLDTLPMVENVQRDNARATVHLGPGADTQDLLRAVVPALRVRLFEEKRASLHEIFVRLVGRHDA